MVETKCASCGTITECIPVCGAFGAITYSCCPKCLAEGREPYRNIVDYVASAGHWPEDINATYQQEVRYQLILHEKSEESFKLDVELAIAEELVCLKDQIYTFEASKEDF